MKPMLERGHCRGTEPARARHGAVERPCGARYSARATSGSARSRVGRQHPYRPLGHRRDDRHARDVRTTQGIPETRFEISPEAHSGARLGPGTRTCRPRPAARQWRPRAVPVPDRAAASRPLLRPPHRRRGVRGAERARRLLLPGSAVHRGRCAPRVPTGPAARAARPDAVPARGRADRARRPAGALPEVHGGRPVAGRRAALRGAERDAAGRPERAGRALPCGERPPRSGLYRRRGRSSGSPSVGAARRVRHHECHADIDPPCAETTVFPGCCTC